MAYFLTKIFFAVYFWRALELGPRSTGEEYTRGVFNAMKEDGLVPLMKKKKEMIFYCLFSLLLIT